MSDSNYYGLSEMEYELMKFIWSADHVLNFAEILKYCNNELDFNWAKTTLHTYLTRLIQKGVLDCDKRRGRHLYTPKITREELASSYANKFVDTYYNGSLKDLVLSFTYKTPLSKDEVRDLQKLLDENFPESNEDAEQK